MNRTCLKLMIFLMIGTLMFGCAQLKLKPEMSQPQFKHYDFTGAKYMPKVDNFLVILDASNSMAYKYVNNINAKTTKFDIAKDFLIAMNMTIPEMDLMAGIRSFGHHAEVSKEKTALFYGMTDLDSFGFESALDAIARAGGHSPMSLAIDAGTGDLKSVQGKTAVIVVSDGKDMNNSSVQAARAMKDAFGDNLCIYTMLIGDDAQGAILMKQIADAGGCGFAARADDFHTSNDMGDFVSKVFLGGAVKVSEMGVVYFDFDMTDIQSQYFPVLDKVAAYMKNDPTSKMEVQGHTDNSGTERYNLSLSERRAKAVANLLVKQGIARNRLNAVGFGYFKPAAPNSTAEGRAKNRRAEFLPIR
ncbi:OmpA family protein [Thermodesulfobacteriota bacterium]